MRKDMSKVIVERPRRGGRSRLNRSRLANPDDLPKRVGLRRYRTMNLTRTKYLNENLQPLIRYLEKQVGRPWSKVYSEISENLNVTNTVQQHVRDHIEDIVVVKVAVDRDGNWMNGNRWTRGWYFDRPWHHPLYVDPNDGLLKSSDKLWRKWRLDPRPWRRKRVAADPDVKRLDEDTELHRIKGIWYEVRYRTLKQASPEAEVFDKLARRSVPARSRHAYAKIQLSGARLKSLGLTND